MAAPTRTRPQSPQPAAPRRRPAGQPALRPPPPSVVTGAQASATVFVVLRRMRIPLITLIVIFAVSVLGLTLIPGEDADGNPARMGFFHAFYVMSYTATTIGFGELPNPFTDAQRLWVTGTVFLTVIGWAYAIGALLSLLQDRAFRSALALQHVTRKVQRLREPFLVIAGYGQTGESLGRSFDSLGRRFTVVDVRAERIDALELNTAHADVPGLVGDARNPHDLHVAGLGHPCCAGVLALTDDDDANLAVAMAAALLRPDLPVVTRTTSAVVAHRMRAFGEPTVINPFDRFGDRLRLALNHPAAYQLTSWLEAGPGAELPERAVPPAPGRWVVCGYGRFGRHFANDLRAEGLEVTTLDLVADAEDPAMEIGDGSDPDVLARAHLEGAVAFVAGTDNDTTNLSLVAEARRVNPDLFVAARRNTPTSEPMFAALDLDALLVPTEVVAQEAYARLSTPLLWRFLRELGQQDDELAAGVVERLADSCGHRLPALWTLDLDDRAAPALGPWLRDGELRLSDLLRDPEDREEQLAVVVLLVERGGQCQLAPGGDLVLRPGDRLLLAGRAAVRRALAMTLVDVSLPEYLVTGRRTPSGWLWRRLSRQVLTGAA